MQDLRNGGLRALVLGSVLVMVVGLVGFAATATAQEPATPADQAQPVAGEFQEEVSVTGTLIPRPTLEAMSPVSTLEIEELSYRGLTRLEDLLTSLPQVFAAQNSTIANGASGTATVDLRYLGAVRTLVLVDGRRLQSGDAFSTSPDLNFIPASLVKRVDILTGGASSVYGADAVAGVVNFVLDKDFEGFRGGIQFGGYQHDNRNDTAQDANAARGFSYPTGQAWDGGAISANIAYGGKFAEGKGHASMYVDYRRTSALLKQRRDYLACSFALGDNGPICGGSGTIADGQFQAYDADWNLTGRYTLDRSGPGNTFRNRTGADVFNYGPYNYMQRPDERWAAGGFINYKFNKALEAYVDIMTMDDYTDAQIAPSGDFGNTQQLNCDNPMLSDQQRQLLCTNAGWGPTDIANIVILKRNVEGGGRVSQLRHTALRYLGGIKGDLGKGWAYDFYGLQGEVHSPQKYQHDFSINRLQEALLVTGDPNDPSTWQCSSGNPNCVPYNIFRIGGVTQAALNYLEVPLILDSGTKTSMVSLKFTGDLGESGVKLPTASEGIQLALGLESRNESLFVHPDMTYQTGDGAGQGGATNPVEGAYRVDEGFLEVLLPLMQDMTGAKDLSLELGYRYSDYTTSGGHSSYKGQLSYAPLPDLRLRLGFNRATRAPNVQELFVPTGVQLLGTSDPCAGANPSYTQAECARTGVSAAQYGHIQENPAGQYNALTGGNVNLDPETADTFTAGLVITPAALPTFTAALDYYDIKIEKVIGALFPDDVINTCATTGNPTLCSLIHRDVAGTLWLMPTGYTIANNQNIGVLTSKGLDVNATYFVAAGNAGLLSFNLIGTYLQERQVDTGLYKYDCAGYFGNQCGDPTPTWRHLARVSWETNWKTTLSLGWRMIGAVDNDDLSSNPALGDPSNVDLLKTNDQDAFGAAHYFDLAASINVIKGVQFTLGINNLADKEPPIAPGDQGNDYGPGYHGTYDPYGRYLFTSIQFTF